MGVMKDIISSAAMRSRSTPGQYGDTPPGTLPTTPPTTGAYGPNIPNPISGQYPPGFTPNQGNGNGSPPLINPAAPLGQNYGQPNWWPTRNLNDPGTTPDPWGGPASSASSGAATQPAQTLIESIGGKFMQRAPGNNQQWMPYNGTGGQATQQPGVPAGGAGSIGQDATMLNSGPIQNMSQSPPSWLSTSFPNLFKGSGQPGPNLTGGQK